MVFSAVQCYRCYYVSLPLKVRFLFPDPRHGKEINRQQLEESLLKKLETTVVHLKKVKELCFVLLRPFASHCVAVGRWLSGHCVTERTDSCMEQLGHHKAGRSKLTGLCCSRAAAKDALELHFSSRLTPACELWTLLILAWSF